MVPDSCPNLRASYLASQDKLLVLSERIRAAVPGPHDEICVVAVGSYGRREAHVGVSDFEWMTIYDDKRVAYAEAMVFQSHLTSYFAESFGRDKFSINKTFGEIATIDDLCTNVGGEADSNRALTYRMLMLCEGFVVNQSGAYESIINRLAETYGRSHTAGHRLLSLATDIARHWRTLRIDYKHKVDDKKKPWALRALKLRSARRLAYFSSAHHFVGLGPRIDYARTKAFDVGAVASFMKTMSGNPVERLVNAAAVTRGDKQALDNLLMTYDEIHGLLGDANVRADLDALTERDRLENQNFVSIRERCVAMHKTAAEFIMKLPAPHQQEMIEMFLL